MRRALVVVLGLLLTFALSPGSALAHDPSPNSHASVTPPALQGSVEVEETHDGDLEVLHEDGTNHSRYLYFLKKDGGKRLSLDFGGNERALKTGDRVRVKGVRRSNEVLALNSSPGTVSVLAAAAVPNTFGAQNTLVILVKFQDKPTAAYSTPAQIQSIMFQTSNPASVTNFYREASYQQAWLTGDVVGPYVIPLNSTTCDYVGVYTYATQAAAAAGVNLSSYTRFVYAFPSNACGWWGLGTVGGYPSHAWINGSFQNGVASHELGHNFGLFHSHALECGSVPIGGTCGSIEYGDSLDVMGWATPPRHFNAVQKERLGWLGYGSSPPITAVQSSGVYTIDPYEPVGSNPKALKVRTFFGDWYYVEFRQSIGFDAGLTTNVMNGVVVHYWAGQGANSVYLLDMTPATASWSDPGLVVGQSFTDSAAGITISPVSVAGTGAAVNVTMASSCVRRNPTVTATPAQQQGSAGTMLTYTVSVRNNDDSLCGAAAFTAQASAPAGWTRTFGSPTLTVSPGATVSTTLQVTSPSTVAPGSYTITPAASNTSQPTYTASATAMYTVASSCVRQNPTVTVSPAQQQGAAGTMLTYTVSVTNKDGASCGTATFSTQANTPTGWTATFTPATLTVSPGATVTTALKVTSPASAPAGSYTVVPTASNTAQPTYTASTTATYSVAASGGGGGGTGTGGAGVFTDDFNRADSSSLGNGWVQVRGNLMVKNGRATNAPAVNIHMAMLPGLAGPTQTVAASFASVDSNVGPRFGLVVRYTDAQNYYMCYRLAGGTSALRISRVVNGVEKVLKQSGFWNPTRNVFFGLGCQVQGTQISLQLNGATKISVSDATFSTGSVGLLMGYTGTSAALTKSQLADNFSANVQ